MDKPNDTGRWLCLDAKYRVGRRNLADAFSSVHIYWDALRYEGRGGSCREVALLAPAITPDSKEWFSETFFDKFRCGVWELHPGVKPNSRFSRWIVDCLEA